MISQLAIQNGKKFNEAEVRQHIINPVLDRLGYTYGSEGVYIRLEDKLATPRLLQIGRASSKDFPIGFPDYTCGLSEGRGSFVVEAKGGNVNLTETEIGQAHSYAAHAEVGANYFMLVNGTEFRVYETLSGHCPTPLLRIPVAEMASRFHELESVLAPSYLSKNCAVRYDMGIKLGQGLGSKFTIRNGEYFVEEYRYRFYMHGNDVTDLMKIHNPQFAVMNEKLKLLQDEFSLRVTDGKVERDEAGRIITSVTFDGVTKGNTLAMAILGIGNLQLGTNDEFISTDPDLPTVFVGSKNFAVSQGTMMPQLLDQPREMPENLSGEMMVQALMHCDGDNAVGNYVVASTYRMPARMGQSMYMQLDLAGKFSLRIDQ